MKNFENQKKNFFEPGFEILARARLEVIPSIKAVLTHFPLSFRFSKKNCENQKKKNFEHGFEIFARACRRKIRFLNV